MHQPRRYQPLQYSANKPSSVAAFASTQNTANNSLATSSPSISSTNKYQHNQHHHHHHHRHQQQQHHQHQPQHHLTRHRVSAHHHQHHHNNHQTSFINNSTINNNNNTSNSKSNHQSNDALPTHLIEERQDVIFRKVRGILNKITPETFDKLSKELVNVGLDSPRTLRGVIYLLFDKALKDLKYSSLYAKLCQELSEKAPNFETESGPNTFCKFLISKCEDEFERRRKATEDFDGKNELTDEEFEQKAIAKQKMLGNIKFICELGKKRLLQEEILHECIRGLLSKKKERPIQDQAQDLECLCQIMRTIGSLLDIQASKNLMDQYFERIDMFSKKAELPSRIRFMLRDVIDLRNNKWRPRPFQREDNVPQPLSKLRQDAGFDPTNVSTVDKFGNNRDLLNISNLSKLPPNKLSMLLDDEPSFTTSTDIHWGPSSFLPVDNAFDAFSSTIPPPKAPLVSQINLPAEDRAPKFNQFSGKSDLQNHDINRSNQLDQRLGNQIRGRQHDRRPNPGFGHDRQREVPTKNIESVTNASIEFLKRQQQAAQAVDGGKLPFNDQDELKMPVYPRKTLVSNLAHNNPRAAATSLERPAPQSDRFAPNGRVQPDRRPVNFGNDKVQDAPTKNIDSVTNASIEFLKRQQSNCGVDEIDLSARFSPIDQDITGAKFGNQHSRIMRMNSQQATSSIQPAERRSGHRNLDLDQRNIDLTSRVAPDARVKPARYINPAPRVNVMKREPELCNQDQHDIMPRFDPLDKQAEVRIPQREVIHNSSQGYTYRPGGRSSDFTSSNYRQSNMLPQSAAPMQPIDRRVASRTVDEDSRACFEQTSRNLPGMDMRGKPARPVNTSPRMNAARLEPDIYSVDQNIAGSRNDKPDHPIEVRNFHRENIDHPSQGFNYRPAGRPNNFMSNNRQTVKQSQHGQQQQQQPQIPGKPIKESITQSLSPLLTKPPSKLTETNMSLRPSHLMNRATGLPSPTNGPKNFEQNEPRSKTNSEESKVMTSEKSPESAGKVTDQGDSTQDSSEQELTPTKSAMRDAMVEKFLSVVGESNANPSQQIAKIKELKLPKNIQQDCLTQAMKFGISLTDVERNAISKLLPMLIPSIFEPAALMNAFRNLFGQMQALEVETPTVKSLIANFLSRSAFDSLVSIEEIGSALYCGKHHPLFLIFLQKLNESAGQAWLSGKFITSRVNLLDMLPEVDRSKDRLVEILKDRGLGFLDPMLTVEPDLREEMQRADATASTVYRWIRENVDPVIQSTPSFAHVLITCLIKSIHRITGEKTKASCAEGTGRVEDCQDSSNKSSPSSSVPASNGAEREMLTKYQSVLQAILKSKDMQLAALYALQYYYHSLDFPKGALLRWFYMLYDLEIVVDEVFFNWKEEINDVIPGKGQALFQVNTWLNWLAEADSEEEDEDEDEEM